MWLLALTWFALLASIGFTFPYFGLYLLDVAKLSGSEAGVVLAIMPVMSVLFQPLLAALSDRSGARTRVLAGLALASSAALLLMFVAHGFWALLLSTALFALCSVTLVPGLWAVSFAITSPVSPRALGYVRAAGTVGFGVAVVGFPWLEPWLTSPQVAWSRLPFLSWTLPLSAISMFFAALALGALPRGGEVSTRARLKDLTALRENGPFLRLLVVMFLAFLGLHGPTLFFPVLIQANGGGVSAVGHMWLIMLVLEAPLVMAFGSSVKRIGIRRMMLIGLIAGAARWLLSAWLTDLTWISIVQALHGVTVWGTVLGAAAYVDEECEPSQRSTAQSLLSVVSAGLGGMFSSLLAGWLVQHSGPKSPPLWGGLLTLGLAVSVWWILPESKGRRRAAGVNS